MRSRSTCDVACANGISLRVNQFQSQMRSRSTCDDEPLSATWARGMFQSQMRSRSTCDENAPAATLKDVIGSISDEKPLHIRLVMCFNDIFGYSLFQSQMRSRSTCDLRIKRCLASPNLGFNLR